MQRIAGLRQKDTPYQRKREIIWSIETRPKENYTGAIPLLERALAIRTSLGKTTQTRSALGTTWKLCEERCEDEIEATACDSGRSPVFVRVGTIDSRAIVSQSWGNVVKAQPTPHPLHEMKAFCLDKLVTILARATPVGETSFPAAA
eukprot:g11731.t1